MYNNEYNDNVFMIININVIYISNTYASNTCQYVRMNEKWAPIGCSTLVLFFTSNLIGLSLKSVATFQVDTWWF